MLLIYTTVLHCLLNVDLETDFGYLIWTEQNVLLLTLGIKLYFLLPYLTVTSLQMENPLVNLTLFNTGYTLQQKPLEISPNQW